MHIILNHSSMVPIYEQLMEQIKSDIIQSELKEGEALPSVRTLAGELRISALTVDVYKRQLLYMEDQPEKNENGCKNLSSYQRTIVG